MNTLTPAKARLRVPPDTVLAQNTAADPQYSAWVSANAGSGKTYVLTRRVVRLLLSGVEPSRILCLTYTKAAAANMQIRVFADLAGWATMPEPALRAQLREIEGTAPSPEKLARARRLFAMAVETPGGLRIQTIHAFCEKLLHLFPLEANVPASFEVLDETQGGELRRAAIASALRHALAGQDPRLTAALQMLARETDLRSLTQLLPEALREHAKSADGSGWRPQDDGTISNVRLRLGVDAAESLAAVDRETVEGGIAQALWPEIARALQTSSSNDRKTGDRIEAAIAARDVGDKAAALVAVFLTSSGESIREHIVTKLFAKTFPAFAQMMEEEKLRIEAMVERRKVIAAVERTEALFLLVDHIAGHLASEKHRRGLLDFDDLIRKTRALLSRAEAAWVLYKLDGGIEHLLVDEAQDTSPEQWGILKALTGDFFDGATRGPQGRTVFAVGDEKQSIYSFQGADPRQFGEARAHFRRKIGDTDNWKELELQVSFRSGADVLTSVDAVFADAQRRKGLSGLDEASGASSPTVHESARMDAPGLVELWPPVLPEPAEAADPDAPVDALAKRAPAVHLARHIARRIAHWLKTRSRFEDDAAPIRPGDVIILVQRRNAFFEAMIRALKEARVPVAGADRLTLTEHIAVMDLIALGRAMLLTQDDLTLATVLKSPLIGLSDEDLMALTVTRGVGLWETVLSAPEYGQVRAKLERWRWLALHCDPYRFYASVLGRDRGRHDLLARLGPDAAEAIDVFLADALAYAQRNPPSLSGFLESVVAQERTVKRDMDSTGDAVRVMTVHAAKGLEARIVFLADTFRVPVAQHDPKLILLAGKPGDNVPPAIVWAPAAKKDPKPVNDARLAARELSMDEYRRLLYVAMTRARDRLYVTGYASTKTPATPPWFRMIETALQELPGSGGSRAIVEKVPAEDGNGEVTQWRLRAGKPVTVAADTDGNAMISELSVVPAWARASAAPERRVQPPLRPSAILGASEAAAPQSQPGSSAARVRGVTLHRLFELLPLVATERRAAVGREFLMRRGIGPEREAWLESVLNALHAQAIAPLFAPQSRAEVAMSGTIPGAGGQKLAVSGRVDRLVVSDTEVLVADLKTGRPPRDPDDIPDAIIAQLAVYRALLRGIYPAHRIRCSVLWTALPLLVEADPTRLDAALCEITRG